MTAAPLLTEVLPELAQELETLLAAEGELELAAQVSQLCVVDRCRCRDNFCATFYTVPRPNGSWRDGHRNVVLGPDSGMLILDVVEERVACVEVLYRNEIRRRLDEILP